MEVTYADRKIEELCTDARAANRKLGAQRSKPLETRVAQLRSFDCVGDLLIPGVPGHWEQLQGDRTGQVSARLTGNWRIIVRPTGDVDDIRDSTAVTVIEIVDYH